MLGVYGEEGGVMGGAGYCSMFKLVGRTIGPAQPAFWRPESSPVAGCRFRETHVRILPSYMEAECTVSGTANCAGLSVPNFMLRQEESSSYSCMLLLNTLQTPFPLRLLHPVLRPDLAILYGS